MSTNARPTSPARANAWVRHVEAQPSSGPTRPAMPEYYVIEFPDGRIVRADARPAAQDTRTDVRRAPGGGNDSQGADGASATPRHGRDCDPACRCEANIASGRGGARTKIPPTVELLRQLDQARGDLAAQERITDELRGELAEAHTSLLTAVEGNAPLVRRAEAAESALERVRALLGEVDLFTPMNSQDAGEVFAAESVRDLIGDLRAAALSRLNGGT